MTLWWSDNTPLGCPVEPEVYKMSAESVGAISTSGIGTEPISAMRPASSTSAAGDPV